MNNFNVLNQHITNLTQAVAMLSKSNVELANKIKMLEDNSGSASISPDSRTIGKAVEEAVAKSKSDILSSIESLINNLDIDKKIEEAMKQVKTDIDEAINVDVSLPEISANMDMVAEEEDILISMKDEKKTSKKKSSKR